MTGGNAWRGTWLARRREEWEYCGMNELVFEVTQESDGGFVAEALGEGIFTEGDSWEELRANVREAVRAYFFDRPAPEAIRLHLVRDEVIA
jgi:predicted RNase H-like HicB family nuclease